MPKALGKKDKFTEVYLDYQPYVMNVLLTKIGNIDDAGDICQEVFIILFNKLDEIENIRKWLLGTIRNVAYKYYLKRDKNMASDIDDALNEISLTYVNGFRDSRILISDAMDNIAHDEIDRQIFDLIAVYNYSYKNAAEVIGLTRRQVEYRYLQMVNAIADYLKKKGIEKMEDLL